MKQYLLSIYQPDGPIPAPAVLQGIMRDVKRCTAGDEGRRRLGFQRWPAPPEHARPWCASRTVRCSRPTGPYRRGQGAHRRLHHPARRRPGRGAGVGRESSPGRPPSRSRSGPFQEQGADCRHAGRCTSPRSSVSSARSTAARWPSWSASSATSTSPRRRSRTRSPMAVQRWPSAGLPPSPAGWIITTARNRAIDRLRREASRERPARAGRRCCTSATSLTEEGAVRDDRLRLIFTCCHPALATDRPGRADAAPARRADHRRRSRAPSWCPKRPWPSGWCGPRARSATRGSPTGCPSDADLPDRLRRRAGRHLPDLQRGLHGQLGRRGWSARTCARRRSGSADCWPS